MIKGVGLAVLFLLCLQPGCADFGTEPPVSSIVWNGSIDGVQLGDDSSTVIRKLGPANYLGIGDFPGYTLYYSSGPHAGVSVTIWTRATAWGIGTRSIDVSAPYRGTTKDGIGLGSTQEQVRAIIGPPAQAFETWDWYTGPGHRTIVRYDSNRVTAITLTDPLSR